jgi:hypothetical protein
MENNIDVDEVFIKMQEESSVPFSIDPKITEEVKKYWEKMSSQELTREELTKLSQEFNAKTSANPEYRLAYLRKMTKDPDMYTKMEMVQLEQKLRERK